MATPIASALAMTLNRREHGLYDQVFRSHPMMAKMIDMKCVEPWGGGGYNLETNVQSSINNTFGIAGYKDSQALAEMNPFQTVTLPACFIDGNITWYEADEMANVGEERRGDYIADLIETGMNSAKNILALQVWGDGSGIQMSGLMAILGLGGMFLSDGKTVNPNFGVFNASSTYANVARSYSAPWTNSWWNARVGAQYTMNNGDGYFDTFGTYNTAEPISLEAGNDGGLLTLYEDTSDNGLLDPPDLGMTTMPLFNKLHSMMAALGAIRTSDRMVSLGFPDSFMYHGAAIVPDKRCPTGVFAFLSCKYIKIRPWAGFDDKFQHTPVQSLAPIGKQGYTMLMRWSGNFSCRRPNRNGALTGKF